MVPAAPVVMTVAAPDLAADQTCGVERRVDVRVRVALAHRREDLVHLTGCDDLTVRADDVGSIVPEPSVHAGLSPPPHRNAATPPATPGCPKWMCEKSVAPSAASKPE